MILHLQHLTRTAYAVPVAQAEHLACLRPLSDAHQQCLQHELVVSPPGAHLRDGKDAYGNHRCWFSLGRPHSELQVLARSLVRVHARFEELDAAASPPWETVREALRYRAGQPQPAAVAFVQPSVRVPRSAELAAYARPFLASGRPVAQALLALMHQVHQDFAFDASSTQVHTPLAQAFAQRRGVCQDFAHILLAALRANGLSARYVSGYLLTQPPPGQARLQGADASHAWVQAWCPGTPGVAGEWLDLDPTNAVVPSANHVRVAVGRDYDDVAPLRGVVHGGGSHALSVAVDVYPADAQAQGLLT